MPGAGSDSRLLALGLNWKARVLLAAGFLGGIFTAMSGSGIDICSFAVLTLLFRLTEKTATPTSVVLMAVNTFIAMCYRHFWQAAHWAHASSASIASLTGLVTTRWRCGGRFVSETSSPSYAKTPRTA